MGTTTRGFPYPELADPPNVPSDMRALAEAVDAYVTATFKKGTATVTFASQITSSVAVVFPAPFATTPVVVTNSANQNYFTTYDAVTVNGFTLFMTRFQNTVATGSVAASWTATAV